MMSKVINCEIEEMEESVVSKTKQGSSSRPEWTWLDRNLWTERMLAALENGVKGGKWFSLIDKVYRPATLESAWQQVKRNKGASGIDRMSIEMFAKNEDFYLKELAENIRADSYQAQGVRRVEIDKGGGKKRPLGIPTVRDRIVQTAVKQVIEPIFEAEFLSMNYGFRPGNGAKDALREVNNLLKEGYTHVVDADLMGYFDSIPHELLMKRMEERIGDRKVLRLLSMWMTQEILSETKRWTPVSGTPQGAVISPLLANVYLHELDLRMKEQGYRMVRYADDFVIMCRTAEKARAGLEEVRKWTETAGLKLHPDKTHVGNCMERGQGFEFLGYRFEAGNRLVRKKSLESLKEKIRARTKRTSGKSLKVVITGLNPMLKGWFGYFKHANKWIFRTIDQMIRRRLRSMLRKQEKRPGFGKCRADHSKWPNKFFAAHGLFTLTEAHVLASQS